MKIRRKCGDKNTHFKRFTQQGNMGSHKDKLQYSFIFRVVVFVGNRGTQAKAQLKEMKLRYLRLCWHSQAHTGKKVFLEASCFPYFIHFPSINLFANKTFTASGLRAKKIALLIDPEINKQKVYDIV